MSNFTKKMTLLLFIIVMICPAAVYAKGLKKGMSFLAARHLLLNTGWQAVNVHKDDTNEYFGATRELMDAHVVEVESCAMDQLFCIFNYKRKRECLQLVTHGEEIKDMRVYNWTNECPYRN